MEIASKKKMDLFSLLCNFLFFTIWYWIDWIYSMGKRRHTEIQCAPSTYLEFIYVRRSSLENVVTDMFHEHSAWLDSLVIMRPCLREEWRCARLPGFAFHLETVACRCNCFVLIHEDKWQMRTNMIFYIIEDLVFC